jgi:hypothetical protein
VGRRTRTLITAVLVILVLSVIASALIH